MAIYNGNVVSYGSAGQWYVQVEVWDDGPNTGATTLVHYRYRIIFTQSISDTSNTINWSDPWGTGSANNTSFQSAGTYTIVSADNYHGIQYGGGNVAHFRFYATGMAGGSTGPSVVEFDYPLPARTPSPPSAPAAPTVTEITSYSAKVAWSAPSSPGASIDNYQVQIDDNADFSSPLKDYTATSVGTVTGLPSGKVLYARVRAHNSAGWGSWSAATTFQMLSGMKVGVGGQYVDSLVYVGVGGQYVLARVYKGVGGAWTE